MNLGLSIAFVAFLAIVAVSYAAMVRRRGRPDYPRLDKEGGSTLLRRGVYEPLYSVVVAVGDVVKRLGVSPNAVTWASLAFALLAGVFLALGMFGAAAFASALAGGCDALDGWLARETGTASAAGAILDTTIDRYVELAFFGGLALHYRFDSMMLGLVLAALAGSYMVSYASAKIDGGTVDVPRGGMRRGERMVYLILGVALAPVAALVNPAFVNAPIALVLCLIATLGNYWAIRRMQLLARGLTEREPPRSSPPRRIVSTNVADEHAAQGALRHP